MTGTKQNTCPIQIPYEIPSDMGQGYQNKKKKIIYLEIMQIPKLSSVNHVALFVDQHEAQTNKKMQPIHENTSCCSVILKIRVSNEF